MQPTNGHRSVAAPEDGVYAIRVRGVSVTRHAPGAAPAQGLRQDFALAVANAVAEGGEDGAFAPMRPAG